jgi:NAD(P)-dependent dehydrogenase (short-subunit alcohol dehydrogenase family)
MREERETRIGFLEGKIAILTGGGRGIGAAAAK